MVLKMTNDFSTQENFFVLIKKLPNLIDEGQNLCPWIVGIGVLVCGLVVAGFASYYNRNLLMDWYQSGRDRLNEYLLGEDENDHSD